MYTDPVAYFITFTTYGTWLHGRDETSVDKEHNKFGLPRIDSNKALEQLEQSSLKHPKYSLDELHRSVVLTTIREVAEHRGWYLWAAHVRSNHVHIVVSAKAKPEKVMNDLKAWASRRLKDELLELNVTDRWTQHGSTRYVWNKDDLHDVVKYVLEQQGEPMAVYVATRNTDAP